VRKKVQVSKDKGRGQNLWSKLEDILFRNMLAALQRITRKSQAEMTNE
jgi:hypothetical protein